MVPTETLVGLMGGPAAAVVVVVGEEDGSKHRLAVPQTCPVGQQPPPSEAGQDWKPVVQVSVPWVVGVDVVDGVDEGEGETMTVVGAIMVVICPLTLFVTVTVVVYPKTAAEVAAGAIGTAGVVGLSLLVGGAAALDVLTLVGSVVTTVCVP